MSFGVTLQQRIQQLKKVQADLPAVLEEVQKNAVMRAVERAKDETPPKADTGRLAGQNTLTGALKAAWDKSQVEPERQGNKLTSYLINDEEYASYVNDGHRMDRHFVPGLYIDENGQLARNPDGTGGLVVGTKTKYVKGEFMVDKAKETYEETVLQELDAAVRRVLK